jgi:hypothetical protein
VLKFLNHFKKSRPTDPLEIKIIQARHSFFALLWDGSEFSLESTKEGAEDSSKPMAAWTPFFIKPSRLRVVFEKPCNHLQSPRLFVATLGEPAAVGDIGMANPGNPRQFSIGELWLCGD